MIIVDLKNKRHIIVDNFKDAWRTMPNEWWCEFFESEREYAFDKLFGVKLTDFYTALSEEFSYEIADTIERHFTDMILESSVLDEEDYEVLIDDLEDIYVVRNN